MFLFLRTRFSFGLKTTASNGILYASHVKGKDYEILYIYKGKLVYEYDAGSGPLKETSAKTYNDGKLHEVKTNRNRRKGKVIVDGETVIEGQATGGSTEVNGITGFYFGGSKSDNVNALKKVQQVRPCNDSTGFMNFCSKGNLLHRKISS